MSKLRQLLFKYEIDAHEIRNYYEAAVNQRLQRLLEDNEAQIKALVLELISQHEIQTHQGLKSLAEVVEAL